MPASYPKPDAERRNKTPHEFGWVDLPAAGRQGAPPPLPAGNWGDDADTIAAWWADLWSSPQATQWDQTGRTMHGYLRCKVLLDTVEVVVRNGHELVVPAAPRAAILAEMRQIEDRHGLNPKAMLQLRWRIVPDDGTPETKPKKTAAARRKDPRLSVVKGGRAG